MKDGSEDHERTLLPQSYISIPALKEGRKEMFYINDAHFIYGYMMLENMVNDHSDSERGNPMLPLHGLLFPE